MALVIEDSSSFSQKVPVLLGMLTLHRVIRSMKESEMEQLPMALQQIKAAYEITNNIPVFRWFKFTLKPPYTVAHGNFLSAIWGTSHWTSFVKFGLKTA